MSYIPHVYPYTSGPPPPMHFGHQPYGFDPSMPSHEHAQHPSVVRTPDGFLMPYASYEPVDFYAQPVVDYEEYAENLSRPRLTKEQVDVLETQFQAHPKPNSNVKRQLAMQTNLSLPRVSVGLCHSHRFHFFFFFFWSD